MESIYEETDAHKLLGIESNANPDEIRKAFKKQALKWHPDKHPAEKKEVAEEMFKKIANAYEKLIGKTKTEFYVEDVFANFFNNFYHKYKDWTDSWDSPETKEKRKNATKKLWEEEEEKELNGKNLKVQGKRTSVYCGDIPDWKTFVTARKLETPAVLTPFLFDPEINDKITFWSGDLTRLNIDAIVSSASPDLFGDGCLSAVIHRAAGCKLDEETQLIDRCPRGQAVITRAYQLPARYVIHCVGPCNADPQLLASTYHSALELVLEHKIRTIAFPCVATGMNSFPVQASAQLVLQLVRRWLEKDDNYKKIDRIIFNLYQPIEEAAYAKWVQSAFPLPTTLSYENGLSKGEDKLNTLLMWGRNVDMCDDWLYGDERKWKDGSWFGNKDSDMTSLSEEEEDDDTSIEVEEELTEEEQIAKQKLLDRIHALGKKKSTNPFDS
jgi:O-acetyl-ADP-ribose deacetylase (regulator of RNase III)